MAKTFEEYWNNCDDAASMVGTAHQAWHARDAEVAELLKADEQRVRDISRLTMERDAARDAVVEMNRYWDSDDPDERHRGTVDDPQRPGREMSKKPKVRMCRCGHSIDVHPEKEHCYSMCSVPGCKCTQFGFQDRGAKGGRG